MGGLVFARCACGDRIRDTDGAVAAFLQAIRKGGPSPIPFDELVEVTQVSFAVANAVKRRFSKELSP